MRPGTALASSRRDGREPRIPESAARSFDEERFRVQGAVAGSIGVQDGQRRRDVGARCERCRCGQCGRRAWHWPEQLTPSASGRVRGNEGQPVRTGVLADKPRQPGLPTQLGEQDALRPQSDELVFRCCRAAVYVHLPEPDEKLTGYRYGLDPLSGRLTPDIGPVAAGPLADRIVQQVDLVAEFALGTALP